MPCSRPTLYGLDLDWSQPVYTDRQFKQTRMEYRETQLSVSTAEVPVKLKRLWGRLERSGNKAASRWPRAQH